jgi:small subunit ribosomal protein S1
VDIGFKTEGILPLADFAQAGETPKLGDKLRVSVKGRDPEGYYTLSRFKVDRPKDWTALEQAFATQAAIVGTVTGVIKGGLSVDVGVRAFMPGSRSGARDASEMSNLVGQEIRCRIIKLDVADEDIVVDRRVLAEEEERSVKDRRYAEMQEGDVVSGTVRSLTDYGAFVDMGGVDALLHVGEISWGRVSKPADVLTVGQQVEVKVLKITAESGKRRIAVGMKQLLPHPWDVVGEKYKVGERVRGAVTRVADFGAFVEIEPGIEGLIHVSEMSWAKRVRKAGDLLKQGDAVEAVILGINMGDHRISLGLKQALGDPWAEAGQKFAEGSVVEGPVTNFTKFGAFVQISEGVEGMIHVSEISSGKKTDKANEHYASENVRIGHPQDVLRLGQVVKAQVIALDLEKRQLRLSMKQLVPTGIDEYIAEHKSGDVVTGRLIEVADGRARVELGEGIQGSCKVPKESAAPALPAAAPVAGQGKPDLSSLSSMLNARWKGGAPSGETKPEALQAGQIRSLRIVKLDADAMKIELELV